MTMILANAVGALIDPKLGSKENRQEAAKAHLKNNIKFAGATTALVATAAGLAGMSTNTGTSMLIDFARKTKNTLGADALRTKAARALAKASVGVNKFSKKMADKIFNNDIVDSVIDVVKQNKNAIKKAAIFAVPAAIISAAAYALFTMKAGKIDGKYEEKANQEKLADQKCYTTQA